MKSHDLARELLSQPDVPVVLSAKYGPYIEVMGTSFHEYEEPTPSEEEESEDGKYLSWNIERLEYDEKIGTTITLI